MKIKRTMAPKQNKLNEYSDDGFYQKLNTAQQALFNTDPIKPKRICLLFDFDDCLINIEKVRLQNKIEVTDDNLEWFLDTCTPKAEPKAETWEIIKNKKPNETIMILTGNKLWNVLPWLFNRNLEQHINHIFSVWDQKDTAPAAKHEIIKILSNYFDEIIFFDDNNDYLEPNLNLSNVRLIKVSTKYPYLEQ